MADLSAEEIRLFERIEDTEDTQGLTHRVQQVVNAHVDRAVAEALAPVRAMAEEWERQAENPDDPAYKIGLFSAAAEVRAALPVEPTGEDPDA